MGFAPVPWTREGAGSAIGVVASTIDPVWSTAAYKPITDGSSFCARIAGSTRNNHKLEPKNHCTVTVRLPAHVGRGDERRPARHRAGGTGVGTEFHFAHAPDPAARKRELEEMQPDSCLMQRLARPHEVGRGHRVSGQRGRLVRYRHHALHRRWPSRPRHPQARPDVITRSPAEPDPSRLPAPLWGTAVAETRVTEGSSTQRTRPWSPCLCKARQGRRGARRSGASATIRMRSSLAAASWYEYRFHCSRW